MKAPTRDANNVKRDGFRHPAQTLSFFKVAPEKTVIEITPGNGWYSEILAPLLHDKGHYVAAVVDPMAVPEGRGRDYQQRAEDDDDGADKIPGRQLLQTAKEYDAPDDREQRIARDQRLDADDFPEVER